MAFLVPPNASDPRGFVAVPGGTSSGPVAPRHEASALGPQPLQQTPQPPPSTAGVEPYASNRPAAFDGLPERPRGATPFPPLAATDDFEVASPAKTSQYAVRNTLLEAVKLLQPGQELDLNTLVNPNAQSKALQNLVSLRQSIRTSVHRNPNYLKAVGLEEIYIRSSQSNSLYAYFKVQDSAAGASTPQAQAATQDASPAGPAPSGGHGPSLSASATPPAPSPPGPTAPTTLAELPPLQGPSLVPDLNANTLKRVRQVATHLFGRLQASTLPQPHTAWPDATQTDRLLQNYERAVLALRHLGLSVVPADYDTLRLLDPLMLALCGLRCGQLPLPLVRQIRDQIAPQALADDHVSILVPQLLAALEQAYPRLLGQLQLCVVTGSPEGRLLSSPPLCSGLPRTAVNADQPPLGIYVLSTTLGQYALIV